MRKFLVMACRIDNDLMGLVYAKLVWEETADDAESAFLLECPNLVESATAIDVTEMTFEERRAIRIATRDLLKSEVG